MRDYLSQIRSILKDFLKTADSTDENQAPDDETCIYVNNLR